MLPTQTKFSFPKEAQTMLPARGVFHRKALVRITWSTSLLPFVMEALFCFMWKHYKEKTKSRKDNKKPREKTSQCKKRTHVTWRRLGNPQLVVPSLLQPLDLEGYVNLSPNHSEGVLANTGLRFTEGGGAMSLYKRARQ